MNLSGQAAQGFSGDSGPAIDAELGSTWGVVQDNEGNIYFCDLSNGRIRRIDASTGIIKTIAGTTSFGTFNGDNIPATSAELGLPAGIVLNNQGAILFTDLIHHRIRKIDLSSGVITTICGTGDAGYNGDGKADTTWIAAPTQLDIDNAGNIYFADLGNYLIRKIDTLGYVTTLAGIPNIYGPGSVGNVALGNAIKPKGGIAVADNGEVYFSTDYNKIYKITTAGVLELVAGTGVAGFSGDGGLAIQAELNQPLGLKYASNVLFVADEKNFRIRTIDLATGIIQTVAGSGTAEYNGNYLPATETNIDPFDMFPTTDGDLLISDNGNYMIRKAFDCYNPYISALGASAQKACVGDSVLVWIQDGDINHAEDWVWRTDCFIGDSLWAGDTYPFIMPDEDVTFYVKGEGRCTNSDSCATITIKKGCDSFYNAFSPNGDGFNDHWNIPVVDKYPENEVTIFNRWGDDIMYIQNYSNIDRYWDGTNYDGTRVQPGTYYFTVTAEGLELKGWVQVVK